MPRKIKELIKDYLDGGIVIIKGGKGSHRKLRHPSGITAIVSGKDGDDVKKYQEQELARKINQANKKGEK